MDHISKTARLLALHFTGLANETEEQEMQHLLASHPEERQLFHRLCEDSSFREQYLQQNNWDVETAIRRFDRITGEKHRNIRWRTLLPYAAILIIGLLLGSLRLTGVWPGAEINPETPVARTEITPGSAKALLKLANGQLLNLGDTLSGIPDGNHLKINVRKGELSYTAKPTGSKEYNELILPRGSEYRLILSDGTAVRLNSGSALRYPVSFDGKSREVELTGEAFFDVASDSLHPFCVKTRGIVVKAYGTAFNINTHTDGHIYTALLRGRVGVQVESSGREYSIQPSQLADFTHTTQQVEIRTTDITPHIAWTEGRFVFINETLEEILHTLGLWYDFDVEFRQEATRQLHFSGSMKRYEKISRILDAISYTVGVHIRQEGKKLIVEKK